MDKTSEAILDLEPVTFRYKKGPDTTRTAQFGLVAEDVEKVNPDLVVHEKDGKPYSVRYDQVNAMLLNEFLKEHKRVEEQQGRITELAFRLAQQEATVAKQRRDFQAIAADQGKEIQALLSTVKEQAAQIQNVNARLEVSKTAPQVAANKN